ncbi:MAG: tetratricopeptide repeat protein [Gemmatimonadota bacterium]
MRATALALLLGIAALGFRAWGQEEAGNRAYRRGDYPKAVERYREALARSGGMAEPRYNLGTALLRIGELESARENLIESLQAQSPELRARAFYNLGNALAQEPEDGGANPESLRAAIEAYRRSLLLDPGREDARWNLELAMRRMDELERERQSLAGEEGEPPQEQQQQQGEGSAEQPRPREGDSRTTFPGAGERRREGSDLGTADQPLPRELAEQILRAVEENERSLQREKLRRQRQRVKGPDW